ncbi:MAG: serine hydrolase domain-containing protein [Phenylobacterium sp.]
MYADFERLRDTAIGEGRIAGAVALTVDRDGVTYESAAGRRSADAPAAMTPDTVFWIASMTKAIASVAALQLVERGKLSLDGDLTALLPDLKGLEVFDKPGPDGIWSTRPAKRAPSLRELLTHTSGFSYGFIDGRIPAWQVATNAADPNSGSRAAYRQPLLFDPGEGWAYGVGIDWAGMAVEAASGRRLDAYLEEHLFGPLGMADTGFEPRADQGARQAGMHARTPEGGLAPIPFAMPANPEVLSGGGGLYSTAADYGRFLRMLLNGGALEGARVLSVEAMAALGQVQTGARRAGAWTTAAPHLSRDIDLFPRMQTGWGLAAMISPDAGPNGRSAGSLAWAGLANTYYWADPAAGKGGLILTQVLPFGDPAVLDLLGALERDAYASEGG